MECGSPFWSAAVLCRFGLAPYLAVTANPNRGNPALPVDKQMSLRRNARLMGTERTMDGRTQERLERLLLDTMIYVSAPGLAALPNDPVRAIRYRLEHVCGKKASRVGDPGAGGRRGMRA